MAIRVEVTALYDQDPDSVFRSALNFSEMKEAMRGLAVYEGLADDAIAEEGQTYTVDVTMFGFMKTKGHVIYVEKLDLENRFMQSREHNPMIKRWDHHLSVVSEGDKARWIDSVVIDADWRTIPTSMYAAYIYRHRHRHRKALKITSNRTRVTP